MRTHVPILLPARTLRRGWFAVAAIAAVPYIFLLTLISGLIPDPTTMNPFMNFYAVTLIAVAAYLMAGIMAISAARIQDVRVFLLTLAYIVSASFWAVHALTAPTVIAGPNPWFMFTGVIGVLSAACFLALASTEWSPAAQASILSRARLIIRWFLVGMLTFAVIALGTTYSTRTTGLEFLRKDYLLTGLMILSLMLLALAGVRLAILFQRHPNPLMFSMLVSVAFFSATITSMLTSSEWRLSWWLHHLTLFSAYSTVVVGLAIQYRSRTSISGVLEGLLLQKSVDRLRREYNDTIVALVAAVEARDPYTSGHSANVAELAEQIGATLGLNDDDLEALHLSALIHDIGKIGIPDRILHKLGELTDEEFEIIRQHPIRGEKIVKKINTLQACRPGIRSHHERLDGSGYPDGLVGDAIPLMARIIAVADAYDAMTSRRPYRPPMSNTEALRILASEAPDHLDPRVVNVLLSLKSSQTEPVDGLLETITATN